jgi:DNA-binding NtrC family response regulator
MAEALTLVFAGPKGRATTLRNIVKEAGWQLQSASDWRRALDLAEHAHASVFVYDRDANPEEWAEALREVLDAGGDSGEGPAFLMTSRLADESMWAELLIRRGYDLLMTPFDRVAVLRAIESAHLRHAEAGTILRRAAQT